MALRVELSREAEKRLQRSPADLRGRLVRKIHEVADDPTLKGSEPVRSFEGARRVRVGPWRIVYTWTSEVLRIEAISPRGQVYRDLSRGP